MVAASVGLSGCSPSPAATNSSPSPTVDASVRNYLDLANGFWDDHVAATTGAEIVCLGTTPGRTAGINPELCKPHVVAMLAVQAKFYAALGATTAPEQFKSEDQAFRKQLPVANRDLEALITICDSGNLQAVKDATQTYIADMGPVLDALNQLNPGVEHV